MTDTATFYDITSRTEIPMFPDTFYPHSPAFPDPLGGIDIITTESTLPSAQVGNPSATFAWLDASRIEVDESYQRNLNEKRVNQIARALDPDVFGVVWVSERDDGSVHCLDGQHRVAAALLANPGESVWVPCLIYTGLSQNDEARIFFKMNRHRLAPSATDAWKARLAFSDPDILSIKATLDHFGIDVVMGASNGKLKFNEVIAVMELESLYKEGLLDTVLAVIEEAWKGEEQAHKGIYMRGISLFLRVFSQHLADPNTGGRRMDRTVTVLATMGVNGLEKTAGFYRHNIGANPSTAIARAIHAQFNKGLGGQSAIKLPQWGIDTLPDDGN